MILKILIQIKQIQKNILKQKKNEIKNDKSNDNNNDYFMNKNENYTYTNFYKSNNYANDKVSTLRRNFENNQKIKDYKNKMNMELLEILKKEKQKEELREKQLNELDNNVEERENLEKQFNEERLKSQMKIRKKNDEIKQKIKEYENLLKNN